MALYKGKIDEIPEDAVTLTEEDALRFQSVFLQKWKPQSDIWPLNYGGTFLAALSAVAGIYINNHYRSKLKIYDYGKMATYIPLCAIPAVSSFVLHQQFVTPHVILQSKCPVCIEMRASAIQAGIGCVFPVILAPIATLSIATRFNTYDIPNAIKQPGQLVRFWYSKTKPISNKLFAIFLAQAAAASIITYLEARSIEKLNDKLTLLHYDVDKEP